jgi:hypothetical protein
MAKAITQGKYYEGLKNGLDSAGALKAANEYAEKLMGQRAIGKTPNLFNSKIIGAITQFQFETNNQMSFLLKDIPQMSGGNKIKLASMASQYLLYSYLFNSIYEKIAGRRPTFDPIHASLTALGLNDEEENKSAGERIYAGGKELVSQLPFGNIMTEGGRYPVTSGVPDVAGLLQEKTTLKEEAVKPLAYLLSPVGGGGQAKKTIEGLSTYNKGYSQSPSGRVRFPVRQDIGSALQSAVFGQWALPEAREYFNKDRSVLGEKQSIIMKNLPENKKQEYYDKVLRERAINRFKGEVDKVIALHKTGKITLEEARKRISRLKDNINKSL